MHLNRGIVCILAMAMNALRSLTRVNRVGGSRGSRFEHARLMRFSPRYRRASFSSRETLMPPGFRRDRRCLAIVVIVLRSNLTTLRHGRHGRVSCYGNNFNIFRASTLHNTSVFFVHNGRCWNRGFNYIQPSRRRLCRSCLIGQYHGNWLEFQTFS